MKFFLYYFLLFIIYSILGWGIEVVFCSLTNKKLTSRGFLIGPYCPIYGWASLFMIFSLHKYINDPLVVFIMGALIASILEYITSFFMEKIFHARWWDYSTKTFNINGRICLKNSILFGFLCLILLYVVNPYVIKRIELIPKPYFLILSSSLCTAFVIDNIVTFKIMFNIRTITNTIRKDYTEEMTKKVRKILAEQSYVTRHILNAFPNLTVIGKGIKKHRFFHRH